MKQNLLTIVVFAVLIALFGFAANDWKLPGTKPPAPTEEWCPAHDVALAKCES